MKYFSMFTTLLSFAVYGNSADSIFELSLAELGQLSVVTAASGFEQKSSEAPANVTVISDEDWLLYKTKWRMCLNEWHFYLIQVLRQEAGRTYSTQNNSSRGIRLRKI